MNKLIYLISLLAIILFSGCATQDRIKELQSVEIREYNGENLSSFIEVRDVSIKGPQRVDISNYKLEVFGLVKEPRNYTYDEVINKHQKYQKIVQIDCVEGWNSKNLWEGILLKDILDEVKIGPEATTVIFYAQDGYSTSLPIDFIIKNNILLGHKINGITLTPATGYPFILVAEDKWGYKWIKWVTRIEISDNENYKGYWESRGYSNSGDLNKSFFD
ncbi:MAG: TMAO/DMSO reductase [Candidatus Methanofastidiosum methylothiophilum]|uniref:TMAO/DMSO reductase n=1 Tax=Candidatus Methanofastidiosum methylothiophilum TaxID=1705564 RepID=A0A150ILN4_9EURY|nr:MAG: TMAO/DMSO reductase [Candidatus Methanofastidiosum methylthiophilus]KYC48189.1 MAG: TMAO/DMSO reductase [Candidatus Methanofastidiosum methylthiophilus]KYC50844.1 MAG: TMAO/DMSO reductase [Candidatus Methanofastidiosum methylthiophilus]